MAVWTSLALLGLLQAPTTGSADAAVIVRELNRYNSAMAQSDVKAVHDFLDANAVAGFRYRASDGSSFAYDAFYTNIRNQARRTRKVLVRRLKVVETRTRGREIAVMAKLWVKLEILNRGPGANPVTIDDRLWMQYLWVTTPAGPKLKLMEVVSATEASPGQPTQAMTQKNPSPIWGGKPPDAKYLHVWASFE